MDLDYLHRRKREELDRALEARSMAARAAHEALAAAYAARIDVTDGGMDAVSA